MKLLSLRGLGVSSTAGIVTLLSLSSAQAQTITNQVSYNSLTQIAGNAASPANVTANIISATGFDTQHNKNVPSGPAAYAYGFGVDGTTVGETNAALSTTNVGNNTLSTIIIADDLWIQADTSSRANLGIGSYSLTGFDFLVSNTNASAVTVSAHVRIFDSVPATGLAGQLVGSYDLGAVTLDAKGGNNASVTKLSVPSSSFSVDPVTFKGSSFTKIGAGKYEKRLWAALFFTADATTTTTTELANIGSIVFDRNTAVYADGVNAKGTFFDVGRSNDQLLGDDINGRRNGPAVNYDYNKNFDQLLFTSLFQTYSLDNNGNGPEANFAWLLNGNLAVVPETNSLAFVLTGFLPVAALVRRRLQRKR